MKARSWLGQGQGPGLVKVRSWSGKCQVRVKVEQMSGQGP